MDGTLVDTDYANYLSYRRAVREVTHGKHDIQFNPDKRFNREDLKEQVPQLRDAKYESIVSLKADYFSSCLSETKLNTALADVIRKYGKTHETILVTNCQEERAIKTLRYHQILESFTRMLCRDKSSGKGVANKYENAMALLGVSPDAVIVFENGVSDIEKALLTGVPRENIISIWCLT
jgi:beta-phosphoglucomutase-like phosphatase (HAD superfamily)